ncbi:cytochrome P450 [Streptomyces sp. NPDC007872]|uniref:cytochrome P450 n=1 Tax=Streptomyces sp. NPDC007872 TaxID=3364782 RepID=UPI00368B8BFE
MTAPLSSAPERVAMYEPAFASDPHATYRRMREQHGPFVPVELAPGVPATLVIGYHQALRILNDPVRFPADPRQWQQTVPATCPVLPMLEWRPNALRSSGTEHTRYREANVAAIDAVDGHHLRAVVEDIADAAIAAFRHAGRADLLGEYAWPVAFNALNKALGCPEDTGHRIADGMAKIFDGVNAAAGNDILVRAISDLIALRRRQPGDDITSRLLAHPARLSDTEMLHQLVTLYGAGIEPLTNLIVNSCLVLLTNPEYSANLHAGSASVREALDYVLHRDSPLANYCVSYPPHPVEIDGFVFPAHEPVVISMAGCNNDPALGPDPGAAGSRAHLSWSTGPHACPARTPAYIIAETALTHLLDALPEVELAGQPGELTYRPGPFHRALTSLPVVFPTPTTVEGVSA